tara:strand:+ start:66 stop:716 length:651 start_codon:yes stop_codon:yes gene_type:complete
MLIVNKKNGQKTIIDDQTGIVVNQTKVNKHGKGFWVTSKNGKLYRRYEDTPKLPSSYKNLPKEEKEKISRRNQKRLNNNEKNFLSSRYSVLANRKKNAKKSKKEYDCFFTLEEFLEHWERHKRKYGGPICAITGETMTMIGLNDKSEKYKRNWLNVSVDRLDTERPYTLQNIIFVTWKANKAKNDLSIKNMRAILDLYEERFENMRAMFSQGGQVR